MENKSLFPEHFTFADKMMLLKYVNALKVLNMSYHLLFSDKIWSIISMDVLLNHSDELFSDDYKEPEAPTHIDDQARIIIRIRKLEDTIEKIGLDGIDKMQEDLANRLMAARGQ